MSFDRNRREGWYKLGFARLEEEPMRSFVIAAIVAGGFALVSAAPALAAPANVAAIARAAAESGSITPARCWCKRRDWRGHCRLWACW
jgi:hypothetical protein